MAHNQRFWYGPQPEVVGHTKTPQNPKPQNPKSNNMIQFVPKQNRVYIGLGLGFRPFGSKTQPLMQTKPLYPYGGYAGFGLHAKQTLIIPASGGEVKQTPKRANHRPPIPAVGGYKAGIKNNTPVNGHAKKMQTRFIDAFDGQQTIQKPVYTSYSKNDEVRLVTIGLASANRIRQWAEKTLPNGKVVGEVTNANTLHHKTFKPQKGGLFCERIFGPLKDFQCACVNSKRIVPQKSTSLTLGESQNPNPQSSGEDGSLNNYLSTAGKRFFCEKCDVEYTWSVIRRYQLGYIKLNAPVTHVWYVKGTPSYISLLLDMKKKHVEYVTYCTETLTLENSLKGDQFYTVADSPSEIFAAWQKVQNAVGLGKPDGAKEARVGTLSVPTLPLNQLTKPSPALYPPTATPPSVGSPGIGGHINGTPPLGGQANQTQDSNYKKSLLTKTNAVGGSLKKNSYYSAGFVSTKVLASRAMQGPRYLETTAEPPVGLFLGCRPTKTKNLDAPETGLLKAKHINGSVGIKTKHNIKIKTLSPPEAGNTLLPVFYKDCYKAASIESSIRLNCLGALINMGCAPPKALTANGVAHKTTPLANKALFLKYFRFLIKGARLVFGAVGNKNHKAGLVGTPAVCQPKPKARKTHPPKPLNLAAIVFSHTPRAYNKVKNKKLKQILIRAVGLAQLSTPEAWTLANLQTLSSPAEGGHKNEITNYIQKNINSFFLVRLLYIQKKALAFYKGRSPKAILWNSYLKWFSNKFVEFGLGLGLADNLKFKRFVSKAFLFLPPVKTKSLVSGERTTLWEWLESRRDYNVVHAIAIGQTRKEFFLNRLILFVKRIYILKSKPAVFGHETNKATKLQTLKMLYPPAAESMQRKMYIGCFRDFVYNQYTIRQRIHNKKAAYTRRRRVYILVDNIIGQRSSFGNWSSTQGARPTTLKLFQNKIYQNNAIYLPQKVVKAYGHKNFVASRLLGFSRKQNSDKTYKNSKLELIKPCAERKNSLSYGLIKSNNSNYSNFYGIATAYGGRGPEESNPRIVNNLYCFSHRELWDQEKDWQFFALYYFAASNIDDIVIPVYSHRTHDFSLLNTFFTKYPSTFTKYPSTSGSVGLDLNSAPTKAHNNASYATGFPMQNMATSKDKQDLSVSFSGAGIIKTLLAEYDYFEMKKIDKQNRILLYDLNKFIRKLKKRLWSVSLSVMGQITNNRPQKAGIKQKGAPRLSVDSSAIDALLSFTTPSALIGQAKTKTKAQDLTVKKYYSLIQKLLRETCKQRDALIRRTKFIRKLLKNYNNKMLFNTKQKVNGPEAKLFNTKQNVNGPEAKDNGYDHRWDPKSDTKTVNSVDQPTVDLQKGIGLQKQDASPEEGQQKPSVPLLPFPPGAGNNKHLEGLAYKAVQPTSMQSSGIPAGGGGGVRPTILKELKEYRVTSSAFGDGMVLTLLPVLPPDLRPIVKMGNQIAASDLNRLYQRVIYRNDRLKKFLKDPTTNGSYEMKYAQRLLQEAVDNLIQNGKSGVVPEKDARGRALKSLSDLLKGKQGRFRQYLLGKRVDYSGRSVIVVGPRLKLHECGIPKEMALELYLPFLIKRILNQNYARTVIGAKALINKNKPLTWSLLREIMKTCPVLLNRAPTLHRLGFQAFQPKLVDGRAILLHPLVCPAFNADFDGDQMAVHVPISVEARTEAWKLMLSRNNLLSPATGEPLVLPSQDMVLGCYYLTTNSNLSTQRYEKGYGQYFNSFNDVLRAYHQGMINIHTIVWVKWNGRLENTNDLEQPLEVRINRYGYSNFIYSKSQTILNPNTMSLLTGTTALSAVGGYNKIIKTTPGKILFNSAIGGV